MELGKAAQASDPLGSSKQKILRSRIRSGKDPYSPDGAALYLGRPFAWLIALMKPVGFKYTTGLVMDFIDLALGMLLAPVTALLVDQVLIGGHMERLLPYALFLAGVPILKAFMRYTYRILFETSSYYGLTRLRDSIYQQLQSLDRRFYHKNSTGQVMSKLTSDLDMLRHFWAWTFWVFLDQLLTFMIGGIYLLFISWKLTLACLLFTPIIVWIASRFRKKVRSQWGEIRSQLERLNAVCQQNISANRIVRAFVRKDFETKRFDRENEAYFDRQRDMVKTTSHYIPALEAFSGLINIPLIVLGGYFVIRGEMTIGQWVAFSSLLFVFENPMRSMGNQINEIQRASSSAIKLCEMLTTLPNLEDRASEDPGDEKSDREQVAKLYRPGALKALSQRSIDDIVTERARLEKTLEKVPDISGDIVFDHVSFSYLGELPHIQENKETQLSYPVLEDVSLEIKKGQRVGLIGSTGSGKSTLIRLISRLYDPQIGKITIGGVNLRDIPLGVLRKNVAVVNQEVFLFSDTVESNIAFADPLMPNEDILRYAQMAAADGFVRRMEHSYETVVGERGVGLSGGQKQRLSLARALAADCPILILDDTTSALDLETDRLIRQNLSR